MIRERINCVLETNILDSLCAWRVRRRDNRVLVSMRTMRGVKFAKTEWTVRDCTLDLVNST
jgi:hypothetical protein